MPGSIPYNHPSLVLGQVADTRIMDKLQKMSRIQMGTDAAQEKLNSLVLMKRSMTMTMNELKGMGVDLKDMENKLKEIDQNISSAANEYISKYLQNETTLEGLKNDLINDQGEHSDTPESPIDFKVSKLEPQPLYTESLKLDSQYFSVGSNMQGDVVANIQSFVRDSVGQSGEELAQAVSSQVVNQNRNHQLCGTLIIVANCTHRHVGIFNPLVIDPDKAVRAWNQMHDEGKRIQLPEQGMPNQEGLSDDSDGDKMTLITGAAYASSFVGMVHVLKSSTEQTGNFDQLKEQLEQKLQVGGWLSDATGGVGIDPTILNNVKAFLSTQSVSTHISVVTMGVIPSIKSNKMTMGVKELAGVDGNKIKDMLAQPKPEMTTLATQSDSVREHQRMLQAQNMMAGSMISTMADVDKQDNQVLDINSLMNALDNYITSVNNGEKLKGAPIHFYTRSLTRSEILRLWNEKYFSLKKDDEEEE